MAKRKRFALCPERGPGSSMESWDGDITTFPSCLGPEGKVKVKEKQNRVVSSELR